MWCYMSSKGHALISVRAEYIEISVGMEPAGAHWSGCILV